MATSDEFRRELSAQLLEAEHRGKSYIDINSGKLHRAVGGYPDPHHRMPVCCNVMYAEMTAGDVILESPPKRLGASLVIRYQLPRGN